MSNYDNPELRYPCFSDPGLVSHSHPRSLSLNNYLMTGGCDLVLLLI